MTLPDFFQFPKASLEVLFHVPSRDQNHMFTGLPQLVHIVSFWQNISFLPHPKNHIWLHNSTATVGPVEATSCIGSSLLAHSLLRACFAKHLHNIPEGRE